jgi:hypothetical protein
MENKDTEKAQRYSIWLSDDQVNFITTTLVSDFGMNLRKSENPIDVIMDLLHLCDMPVRYVRPKNNRGQGRKKGSKNNKHNSEQDMFRVNLNSLALCAGGLEDAE